MSIPTLLYHDVIAGEDWSESGFDGGGAAVYKMRQEQFAEHVERLRSLGSAPALLDDSSASRGWRLTFDDGGISSLTVIAPLLDPLGWKGYFFMTTGRIGHPGFLDRDGIREMVARGHVIGSHSVTHPLAMASCTPAQLRREWQESGDALAEILGERPTVASIPGGAFSPEVARAAGEAGIRHLFTSEPTSRSWTSHGVTCIGRYTLWRGMSPEVALSCARGRGLWPTRQRVTWEAKKMAKRWLGAGYLAARERFLRGAA